MTEQPSDRRRVRVWFGTEVICSHVADPVAAERNAALMARRFAGLTITVDDAPEAKGPARPHDQPLAQTVK